MLWWLSGALLVGLLGWLALRQWRKWRIARLYATPLPAFALDILAAQVPLYRRLPDALKARLHGCINVFLHDKVFVGCNGLEISDEIRLVVAGNACLLVLNRQGTPFPGFQTILVYPDTYVVPEVIYDGAVEIHDHSPRAGESWERGPVVLSWADIREDAANPGAGFNVVLHEFAHKLDEENVDMDGLPLMGNRHLHARWSDVMQRTFEDFMAAVERGEDHVIDEYGAESPAEFFAVVTETFFEKPLALQQALPDLYGLLEDFYGLDPASWPRCPGAAG